MTFRPRRVHPGTATLLLMWGTLIVGSSSVRADEEPAGPVQATPRIVDWMSLKHFIQPGVEVSRETGTRLVVYHPTLDRSITVTSEWTPDADIYRLPDPDASARWVWAATPRLLNDPERPRETWGHYFRAAFLQLVRLNRPDPFTAELTTQRPLEVRPPDTAPATISSSPSDTAAPVVATPAAGPPPLAKDVSEAEEPPPIVTTDRGLQRPETPPMFAQAVPGLGPTLGLATGPRQVRVGARIAVQVIGRGGVLGMGLNVGDGDGRTTVFASLEGAYHLGTRGDRWHPYVGAGVGPAITHDPDGSRVSRLQLTLRGGMSRVLPNRRGAIFLELASGVNGPDATLSAGWTLAFHPPR